MKDGIAKNVELLIKQYDEDIETMKKEFEKTLQDSLQREEEMKRILEAERNAREEELARVTREFEERLAKYEPAQLQQAEGVSANAESFQEIPLGAEVKV
jgi:hypothetical protein